MSVFDLITNILLAAVLGVLFGPLGVLGYLIALGMLSLGSAFLDRLPR